MEYLRESEVFTQRIESVLAIYWWELGDLLKLHTSARLGWDPSMQVSCRCLFINNELLPHKVEEFSGSRDLVFVPAQLSVKHFNRNLAPLSCFLIDCEQRDQVLVGE